MAPMAVASTNIEDLAAESLQLQQTCNFRLSFSL
jgi:hypothetical protein